MPKPNELLPAEAMRLYAESVQMPPYAVVALDKLQALALQAQAPRGATVTPLPGALTTVEVELAHLKRELERVNGVCAEKDVALAKCVGERDSAAADERALISGWLRQSSLDKDCYRRDGESVRDRIARLVDEQEHRTNARENGAAHG